jgi:membrane protein DedA with SNARE-associated domain
MPISFPFYFPRIRKLMAAELQSHGRYMHWRAEFHCDWFAANALTPHPLAADATINLSMRCLSGLRQAAYPLRRECESVLPGKWLRSGFCAVVELFFIKYGVVAVFLAAMVEADVVPVLTGVVVRLGYVRVGPALLAATVGAFAGDYLWFCAGAYCFQRLQNSRLYRRIARRPETLIRRLGPWQIPASHLAYGTRIATMIFWGAQRMSTLRFALIDGFGCVVLTGILFALGFGFSGTASLVIGRVKQLELIILVGIISALLLGWTGKAVRRML